MSERSVVVRLRAEIADFRRQMDQARRSVKGVGDESETQSKRATTTLGRLVESADKQQRSWDQAGTALVAFGTATVGALGLATKAAIDWESAFAGVRKTVNGSDSEIAALEGELRELARTLPATHEEIAATAEAAGQLGVSRTGIAAFVRTMVDLGETTNLTADEAATSIAQMANIMGIRLDGSTDDVARLGATLVALGNNGASTERDIIQMAQRIAGAGKTIGLTTDQVLALANAAASMGLEVEAGGTSISRVLLTIQKAVDTGGDSLVQFARVAGMSADDFATAFREQPAQAVAAFVEGLGRVQQEGGNTTQVLDDLELGEMRVSDALRRLSSNTQVLNDSLALGTKAWADNTALAAEAEKRYETTAAQLQVTRNNVQDAAIGFGEVLLPAVRGVSEQARDLAEWLGQLDDGQQRAIVSAAGLAGGAALVGGAFLLAFPRVIDTVNAFRDLRKISPRAASGLGKVGKAAGVATVALTALTVAAAGTWEAVSDAAPSASEATRALTSTAGGVDSLNESLRAFRDTNNGYGFSDLEEGLRSLTEPGIANRLADITGEITSFSQSEGRTERTQLVKSLEAMGQALATLAESGNADLAAEQFRGFEDAAHAAGLTTDELLDLMPAYRDALADADAQQQLAAGGADRLSTGLGGMQQTAEEAEASIQGFNDALDRLLGATFGVDEAQDRWQEGLNNLTDVVKANGTALTGTTNEAIANRDAMRAQVEQGVALIQEMAKQGVASDVVKAKGAALREQLIKQATAAGFNRDEVAKLTAALDNVEGIYTATVQAQTAAAVAELNAVTRALNGIRSKTVNITVNGRVTGERLAFRGQDLYAADGAIFRFADGGHFAGLPAIGAQQPQIQPNHGPGGIMWAETGAGPWEAFISGHPAKRDRSIDIWEQTGDMLGLRFQRFDGGGFFGSAAAAPAGASGPVRALVDRSALASAFDGVHLTLEVDGRPVRAVVRAELGGQVRRAGDGRR